MNINKRKRIFMILTAAAAICSMALTGCSTDNNNDEKATASAETSVQSQTQQQTETTAEQETQAPETTTEENDSDTSQTSQNSDSESTEDYNDYAKSAYNAIIGYAQDMETRGTPIYDNLNFEFNLADVSKDVPQDGKVPADMIVKSLIKASIGKSDFTSERVFVGTYTDGDQKNIFVQYQSADESGSIGQYPQTSGGVVWGQFN